jgi:hypothetical protein
MEILRLVTVHPLLANLTLGALPLIVLAYGMARLRRSARWSFTGDVALAFAAIATVATAAFGLIAYLTLDWYGEIRTWALIHLGFGAATAVLLLVLAGARLRRRRELAGGRSFAAALGIALVAAWTGWIGGEILVFRSGMGVIAAGHGALAPPAREPDPITDPGAPSDMADAMARLRGNWGAQSATVARMLVEAPRREDFEYVARHAAAMRPVAAWLASFAEPAEPEPRVAGIVGGRPVLASVDDHAAHLRAMGRALEGAIAAVEDAAWAEDIVRLTRAGGNLTALCAGCHATHRWNGHEH